MGKTVITCVKLTHQNGKRKGKSATCGREKFALGIDTDKDYRG